jgi:Putative transposase
LPLQDRPTFLRHLAPVRKAEWVVYAKAPFAGPKQVLDYVGRYTHRVAISNNRLLDIEDGKVQFRYKDYRNNAQQTIMTLSAEEFIRRFLLHVLPSGFHRIRYYGFLGNCHRQQKLDRCRQLLGMASPDETTQRNKHPKDYREQYENLTGHSLRECPACHRGHMIPISVQELLERHSQHRDTS